MAFPGPISNLPTDTLSDFVTALRAIADDAEWLVNNPRQRDEAEGQIRSERVVKRFTAVEQGHFRWPA